MVVRRNGWYIMLTVVDYLVIVSLRAALLLTVRESGGHTLRIRRSVELNKPLNAVTLSL